MIEMGTSSPTEQLAQLEIYRKQRDQYLTNAEEASSRQEFRKSSELLWGAVAQSIKALALIRRNVSISAHGEFFSFMEQLAREAKDSELYTDFLFVNNLHKNFYDEQFPDSAFPVYKKKAISLIRRLETLSNESARRAD